MGVVGWKLPEDAGTKDLGDTKLAGDDGTNDLTTAF